MTWSPSVIGIGAEKSATTWAWTMLNEHPSVRMSQPKELNFFTLDENFVRGNRGIGSTSQRMLNAVVRFRRCTWTTIAWLSAFETCIRIPKFWSCCEIRLIERCRICFMMRLSTTARSPP